MNEIIYILIITLGVFLFALGGTKLPFIGRGWKGFRRYVYPAVLFLLLLWHGVYYGIALASCTILCFALHKGYGDRTPWWLKFVVGIFYAAPSLLIGYSLWVCITPIVFITLFFLSNWKYTERSFVWKIVECATGFLIGATYVGALNNLWLVRG